VVEGVAKFAALGPLQGPGGGEYPFNHVIVEEDVDHWQEGISVAYGHCDNH